MRRKRSNEKSTQENHMNSKQLQEAIGKARAFVSTQLDSKTTPSYDLKESTIEHIKALQKIQATRAAMLTVPTLTEVVK